MRNVRIFYSNNTNQLITMNGTNTEIQNHYRLGKKINVGTSKEDVQSVEALTIE